MKERGCESGGRVRREAGGGLALSLSVGPIQLQPIESERARCCKQVAQPRRGGHS